MSCPKTTKIDGVTLHSLCFQTSGKKIFCTKLLQAMKSGFLMITLNVENHGLTLVNFRHRKCNIHAKKVLLYIWWDRKGVLYYKLLQSDETIMSDRYQQQLTNVSDALEEKRPLTGQGHRKVILLYDARHMLRKRLRTISLRSAGNFSRTRCVAQTWRLSITIHFDCCSIICLIHIS